MADTNSASTFDPNAAFDAGAQDELGLMAQLAGITRDQAASLTLPVLRSLAYRPSYAEGETAPNPNPFAPQPDPYLTEQQKNWETMLDVLNLRQQEHGQSLARGGYVKEGALASSVKQGEFARRVRRELARRGLLLGALSSALRTR